MQLSNIYEAYTEEEAQVLASRILVSRPTIVGLDTETQANFNGVSLLSVSTHDSAYLFSLTHIGKPPAIMKLLSTDAILKVGVAITQDAEKLTNVGYPTRGCIDIQYIARSMELIGSNSLACLAEKYVPQYIGKDPNGHKAQWNEKLDTAMKLYAANDAYYSLLVYEKMMNIKSPEPSVVVPQLYDGALCSWIQVELQRNKVDRKVSSFVPQIVNSYGPWRNLYTEKDRTVKAQQALEDIIKHGALPHDPVKNIFLFEAKK